MAFVRPEDVLKLDAYKQVSLRSVPIFIKEYRMSSYPLGFCVIINNEFKNTFLERKWSNIDKAKLIRTWQQLGFQIKLFENQNWCEMRDALNEIANDSELKKHSCFVMMILSDGHSDAMLTNDHKIIHLSEIFEAFNDEKCENLRGKPKIFGIDIHREYDSIEYSSINGYREQTVDEAVSNLIMQPIDNRVYNDMIVSYGTCSGNKAIYTNTGSWYINALCIALDNYGTQYEIADILRIVNHLVSTRVDENVNWRQSTEFKFIGVSRRLFFRSFSV